MFNIKIDLIKLTQKQSKEQGIRASALNDDKMHESERLARAVLAPLAVAELYKKERKINDYDARKLGELFADCCAECSGALWFCGSREDTERLKLADGYTPRAFGRCCVGGCFVLILENNKEKERAYLVRPSW